MFDHFTMGMQARPVTDDLDAKTHLSPRQRPRDLDSPTTPAVPPFVSPSGNNMYQTPPQPIDNLVHELSRQTLFPEFLRRPTRRLSGSSPSIIAELSAVALEVDNDCNMDISMDDAKEHEPVVDWKRSRRQWHSRFVNNPNNARAMEARLRDMISDKTQCDVRPSATASSTSSVPTYPDLPKIEADNRQNLELSLRLEADEGFGEDDNDELMQTALSAEKQRLLGGSDGLRHYGALRFRGSAETALRCPNVVRHRPRMRKRKGPGPSQEPRPMKSTSSRE
ncbi:hypothetical protein RB213_008149 [Colletotrichum asianum]|uniref:Uncharacterized protein n=1 Tax=Colletotrichum asianum TaxID=702518 RepID=A0A8H3WJF3_9PEZI|nr:hypothetical protein GQ607_005929 [Colletotrichum asianum]